ncbi:hypothetical protein [Tomitella cavernea]|uniref:Uncharacterized protein n=1 Tax=Tomitella cavernea TaxID=1387982 RepID=A0ABP9C1U5_9ACTN|nr:hypothetical protein [Tomitella cavernea]
MGEGGIGWVPMLIDRLDNIIDRSGYGLGWDERPSDVIRKRRALVAETKADGFNDRLVMMNGPEQAKGRQA